MFAHNLKIAFRNLRKYKTQTLISIIGLAVGFVCFALSALWIRYEMTFDNFHRDAEQIYVIYRPNSFRPSGQCRTTPLPLPAYLKETFPEVAEATAVIPSPSRDMIILGDIDNLPDLHPALVLQADTSIFRIFDIEILEGNSHFLFHGSGEAAITQRKARQLFGNDNPIGETINWWGDIFTITAVVADMPKRSNYAFDLIVPFVRMPPEGQEWWVSYGWHAIIKLHRGVDVEAFKQKLYEHEGRAHNLTIKPLTRLRYLDPDIGRDVRFQHILIFSLSGLLVVLCSLFNFFTLFVSRFRIRQKELALRMVCGASGRSLLAMLSVEFLLTLLFAVLLGGLLTRIVYQHFLTLSGIQTDLSAVYLESLVYIGGIILVSLLIFWLILLILRHRSLNLSIRRSNKNVSRKVSVVVQLIISIGFAFCSIVILKQMHFLQNTDELGFSFQNRGALLGSQPGGTPEWVNHLNLMPEITRVVNAEGTANLVPLRSRSSSRVTSWDDKPADVEHINIERMFVTPEYIDFWNFQLIAGEMLTDADSDLMVLLNENAVRAFGWYDAVGKRFNIAQLDYTVKGVIRNIYNFAPTVQAAPTIFLRRSERNDWGAAPTTVLFQFSVGSWDAIQERVSRLLEEEYGGQLANLYNAEEEYAKFLQSENALMTLLSFVSIICVLICIFGFVSLVSLTCEERRKEIAIRKINGATVGNILGIFAKEYFLLLVIGAAVAFAGGYIIMQHWLEQYVKQTAISVWIYLSVIAAMALIIVLCVGWRVWKTSRENPADVVKSE
jgi:ABC-type antimicrobial peptide transport system permease subunit